MSRRSNIATFPSPRTFTKAERVVEFLAEKVITDPEGYQKIADSVGVSKSTIGNIASRKTKWPRPNTFFGILNHYKVKLDLN